MAVQTLRQALDKRFNDMLTVRREFERGWKDAARFILPSRPRWTLSDTNRERINSKILDGTATQALRVAQSGLLAGMASPSRPWFELTTRDTALSKSKPVATWLEEFRDAILGVFDRSNFYTALGSMFGDELVFGTAAMGIFRDPQKLIRCETFPVGSYVIAQDERHRVNTFAREFTMTAERMVKKFGMDRLSLGVRSAFEMGQRQRAVNVRHAILPNDDYTPGAVDLRAMPWLEVYWEAGQASQYGGRADTPNWSGSTAHVGSPADGLLMASGYHEFPIIVARWDRNEEDVWATSCPGWDALPDIRQLQTMERLGLNGLNKMIDPPLKGGPGVENRPVSLISGAVTIDVDIMAGNEGVRPIHEVRLPLEQLEAKQEQVRQRIKRFFYEDLFLMLLGDARAQPPTAAEIRAREREKLAVLGPTLERHSDDVFDPVIDRVSAMMIRFSEPEWAQGGPGIVPMPPTELQGAELRVEYISEVAQAQRLAGLGSLERHSQYVGAMAAIDEGVLDLVNTDAMIREYAEVLGITPKATRSEEEVDAIRAQQAQQQQMAMAQQALPGLAKAASEMADVQQKMPQVPTPKGAAIAPTGMPGMM